MIFRSWSTTAKNYKLSEIVLCSCSVGDKFETIVGSDLEKQELFGRLKNKKDTTSLDDYYSSYNEEISNSVELTSVRVNPFYDNGDDDENEKLLSPQDEFIKEFVFLESYGDLIPDHVCFFNQSLFLFIIIILYFSTYFI